jgi:SWI/SNF-related matrix-associated actin-dependent regulator of chromatin subfamily A3
MRYVVANTIEESNVLSRQRKKMQLAGGGFGSKHAQSTERLQSLMVRTHHDIL